jgi:hypothetical protein
MHVCELLRENADHDPDSIIDGTLQTRRPTCRVVYVKLVAFWNIKLSHLRSLSNVEFRFIISPDLATKAKEKNALTRLSCLE